MAPLVRELARSEYLTPVLVSTGQHKEMLDQVLTVFGLRPDFELCLMRQSQSLPDLTARAIHALSECFSELQPDAVLVQGDTTSVLAAAIAAFYHKIPVGHVEAGLRTKNMLSPWPEEMNRRLVSPLCQWNFSPTATSRQNLIDEQIAPASCFVTGNTVVDALLWGVEIVGSKNEACDDICERLLIPAPFRETYMREASPRYVLVTGHRRESFGEGILTVCSALLRLVDSDPSLGVIFPCHLNPNVQEPVLKMLSGHPQIALINPVNYLDMIWLMRHCLFIISDSGGIQEEAPTLGKPVLVTRDTTERPEGVEAGTSTLVGTNFESIESTARELLGDPSLLQKRSRIRNPYGDGTASKSIRETLELHLSGVQK
jgi:UDP-N-acetylglucosamine 2-epimerase (non-hydrolysing)